MPAWSDIALGANVASTVSNQLGFAFTGLAFFNVRNIGGFIADVTLSESHRDEMMITEHPVEQGSTISDHAFKRPIRLVITVGFSNSSLRSIGQIATAGLSAIENIASSGFSLSAINPGDFNYVKSQYNNFLTLQQNAIPFSVTTGKRQFNNMLVEYLSERTTEQTENALILEVGLKEVIIVNTQTISNPSGVGNPVNQVNPQSTGTPSQQGQVQTSPATGVNSQYLQNSGINSVFINSPATQ